MKAKSTIALLGGTAIIVALTLSAHTADQTWISANAKNDWNTTTALNWDAGSAWTQTNNAIFGGTGEAVALTEDITAAGITFKSAGDTIAGNAPTQVNGNGAAADDMEIRIPLSNAAGGRLFGRLHVTQP